MIRSDIISKINTILAAYFDKHKGESILAKDMMPEFVKAGIFVSDVTNGLPIRRLLRELDANNELDRIPYIFANRKSVNTNWYFTDNHREDSAKPNKNASIQILPKANTEKKKRDEGYVIDLCDEVLGQKACRQYRFDFLRGDTGSRLPVDAYYPTLNLVIEYRERQHTESVKFFNKATTASGAPRDVQRAKYDQRRRDILPQNGIRLIEISFSDLLYNSRKRLVRNYDKDIETIREMLKEFC